MSRSVIADIRYIISNIRYKPTHYSRYRQILYSLDTLWRDVFLRIVLYSCSSMIYRRISPIGFFLVEIRGAGPCRGGAHTSWLRQVESYLRDTGMAGPASAWTMAEEIPSQGGCGLRRMPPYLTWTDNLWVSIVLALFCRAAFLLYEFMSFKRHLDREMVPPLVIRHTIPLCMWQYKRAFSTTRSAVFLLSTKRPFRSLVRIKKWPG